MGKCASKCDSPFASILILMEIIASRSKKWP